MKLKSFRELTGLKIANEEDFISAVEKIHSLGVKSVVVTSGLETETTKFCYCSMKDGEFWLYMKNDRKIM